VKAESFHPCLSFFLLGWVLFLPGCKKGPYPGDPVEAARKVSFEGAPRLLLDERLTSPQRARVVTILAARFGARAVPWVRKALKTYPVRTWPDRSLAARALRAAGKDRGARALLLGCLADRTDPDLRAEAASTLRNFLPDTAVRRALEETAAKDPSPEVRKAAERALGK